MPPYQPPGPPPSYRWVPEDHPQTMTILVLGIISMAVCQLLGPVAWWMGHNALKEIDANPTAYLNRGAVQAGYICGIIASCLVILAAVVIAVALLAAAAGSS